MESDKASSHGGSTSQASSNGETKKKRERRKEGAEGERDLLDEKKSAEEALHASMYALVKEKTADPWQMTAIKIIMEGLVPVLILLNPQRAYWRINEDNWAWKVVRWSVFRSPIVSLYTYDTYSIVMYMVAGVIFSVLTGIGLLAWLMRKGEQSKRVKTLAKVLQLMSELLFTILYMTILDCLLFYFDCSWSSKPIVHVYFQLECLATPHLLNLAVAGITALVFTISTIAVQTAGCDLNPCGKGVLASPAAVMKIKVICAKATFILAMNMLTFSPKLQALVVTTSVLYVFWLNFHTVPFLRDAVNYVWCGLWMSVLYVCCVYTAMAWGPQNEDEAWLTLMTNVVLYAIWGPLVLGALVTFGWHRWRKRAASKFRGVDIDNTQLRRVHKFSSPHEVELLSRTMRQFDLDGVIQPEAAALGEVIIKAGLASFPTSPMLLILMANFKMEVQQDGPASRTLLQIAAKHQPNFVERYQVFCTVENSKRLKETTEQGLDMHSYVEFKRNYRAVLRAHKEALMQVREFWTLLTHSELHAGRVEEAMSACSAMVQRAYRVYRRVVERYPTNGKLLKCYGTFLEDVKNDFKGATRVYAESVRHGGAGAGAGNLAMDFDFASQPGKPDMLLSLDVNEDAIVIINAEGSIMMVSQGVTPLFGYTKAELEGQNVSMLMPPPFSQRHNGYLQHYKETGDVNILDQVKEVVALHKERRVFPVQICVTKLSGVGSDAVFLGLMRPMPFSKRDVRAWVAPNGLILCCGPMFSALTGIPAEDMVGTNLRTLLAQPEEFDRMLIRASATTFDDITPDEFSMEVVLNNRYTGHVPAHCFLTMGGTDQNRVVVVHFHRSDEKDENLLVVDESGAVTFATVDLAVTLGYTLKALLKLNMRQLIPAPVNMAHEKWLRDAPPTHPITSCRAGTIVNMVGANNQLIPVRLRLSQREEPSGLKHVARITKSSVDEMLDDRRVQVIATYDGTIQHVACDNAIFGFPSSLLKGMHVCDLIDVFADWQQKSGSRDMQLLMLALLDKEQEMPGSAWRVKISHPGNQKLPEAERRPPKSAIFQASLVDTKRNKAVVVEGEEGQLPALQATATEPAAQMEGQDEPPRVMLTLWRREVLVGSMELDAALKVRKSDQFAGLILGRPASSVLKQPLSSFLNVPRRTTWEELTATKRQKARLGRGLLKSTPTMGKISAIKLLEGKHPDGGSMRILVQGVVISELSGKTRIEVTVRPDMTFAAAHSNIWGALGLDFDKKQKAEDAERLSQHSGRISDDDDEPAPEPASQVAVLRPQGSRVRMKTPQRDSPGDMEARDSGGGGGDDGGGGGGGGGVVGGGDPAEGGDFVKRWVRSVSRHNSDVPEVEEEGKGRNLRLSFGKKPEVKEELSGALDWLKEAEDLPDEAYTMNKVVKQSSSGLRRGASGGAGGGDGDDERSEHSEGDSEAASSATGDKADNASGFTASVAGEDEILVDSRRAKLHHKLLALLQQPALVSPVQRLKVQTLLLMLLMLAVRITFFFVAQSAVASQTLHVLQVHNTAIAADRSQVIAAHALVTAFCKQFNATQLAADTVCSSVANLQTATDTILTTIADFDLASQTVYLGRTGKVMRIADPATYAAWTDPVLNMSLYLNTRPVPVVDVQRRSLWELSNRYSANAKEVVWLALNRNSSEVFASNAFNFIALNGPTLLYDAYTKALDTLMVFAWNELSSLNADIVVLLVLEALVLMPLFIFWQWYLIARAERTRLVSWMFMVGLPGPVLRALGSRPINISEDSDAESDAGSDADDPHAQGHGQDKEALALTVAGGAARGPTGGSSIEGGALQGVGGAAPIGSMSLARPVGGEVTEFVQRTRPKVIKPSRRYLAYFLAPFVLCFLMLVVVYGVTLAKVQALQEPLAALNMAMHVIYRFSHVRYVAMNTVVQTTDAAKAFMVNWLNTSITKLDSEYSTLMYGGTSITQEGALFTQPTTAAPFLLKAFADIFFKATNCMRADQSTCQGPGSPWHEATYHGLDAMMQRIISEMRLLTKDAFTALVYSNPRYNAMFHIGTYDLYNGLQMAAQLFVDYSIQSYQQVNTLQIIMLGVMVAVQLLALLFVLRPYLAMRQTELVEVAGLVSHAPQEIDIRSHIKRILRQSHAQHKGIASKPGKDSGGASADPKDTTELLPKEARSNSGLFSPKGFAKV